MKFSRSSSQDFGRHLFFFHLVISYEGFLIAVESVQMEMRIRIHHAHGYLQPQVPCQKYIQALLIFISSVSYWWIAEPQWRCTATSYRNLEMGFHGAQPIMSSVQTKPSQWPGLSLVQLGLVYLEIAPNCRPDNLHSSKTYSRSFRYEP
jgi:hypothetical protein